MEIKESSVDGAKYNSTMHNHDDEPELKTLQETIYDLISDIRDPEKPDSLEDLNVVSEAGVKVRRLESGQLLATIEFVPTVPHCSLASIIVFPYVYSVFQILSSHKTPEHIFTFALGKGLTMRSKLQQCLPEKIKVDIFIKKGTHDIAEEINKQINDKERISAAMENPNLQKLVATCIDPESVVS